ncbi:MAG: LysM peptidoglycan-binding domain-containing protein [Proteobacteria bacterium]|nr:LysM peptidoglycan-binding domain-containing protein [Pseudomonadota bacterium]
MRMIRKAFICLIPLIISGCNFTSTRPVDPPPTADKSHQLTQVAKQSALDADKSGTTIDVRDDLKSQVAIQQYHSNLWFLIKDELVFDRNIKQPSVKVKIAWFARNQEYIDRVVDRAQPYLFHIIAKLKERDMPLDLALLPIVESAYQPFAYSPSRASGIWQFIPSTGKRYGLKQNWWYDGRRDIIAATDAALDYLEMLYKRFNGNWFHALAAYNVGEGRVERAIRKNKKAGKKTDFWSLRLPRETRAYVPSLLAIAEVLKNNAKYNISFNAIPNKPHFESIDIGSQIDLATVSRLSGLSIDDIYTLNPGFNRWATDPKGPHRLLIPVDQAEDFKQKLSVLPASERITWKKHVIRKGESLGIIANRYLTSIAALKAMNQLRGNTIRAGHTLLIPTAKKSIKFYALSADARKFKGLKTTGDGKRYIYTVKRGDNLWDIGRYYGISVNQLTRWNGISRKSLLKPRQKLTVWVKQDENNKAGSLIKAVANNDLTNSYVVKHGDSLWLVARKFDVRVKDLLQWNNLKKSKHLQPGQSLIVQRTITGA